MDSSLQVHEARTGVSVSWAPPFMSALLRWLGHGGHVATSLFVVLCAAATYGGFAIACGGLGDSRWQAVRWRWARLACIIVLVANPIFFLYVGIVWKDVLFASMLVLAVALILAAASGRTRHPRMFYILAIVLLLPTPMVRQHGILMMPILLVPCVLGITATSGARPTMPRWLGILLVSLACVVGYGAVRMLVQATIQGTGDKSTSVGVFAIQKYDITGLLASGASTEKLPEPLRTEEFLAGARGVYSADRLDFVVADARVAKGFSDAGADQVDAAWRALVLDSPTRYAKMKLDQYGWLISLHRLDLCLPVHLGVDGNRPYLIEAGFPIGTDSRDAVLFGLSMWTRHFALYRHWFYMVLLVACTAWAWSSRQSLTGNERVALGSLAASTGILYASFLPTVLACDFRYLYPGLALASLFAIYLLSRPPMSTTSQRHD